MSKPFDWLKFEPKHETHPETCKGVTNGLDCYCVWQAVGALQEKVRQLSAKLAEYENKETEK